MPGEHVAVKIEPGSASSALQFAVVLAYNASDHVAVVEIYDELKRRGLAPWIDSRDHRPGADWRKGFTAALEHATAAIVFLGPSGTGGWQEQELPSIHQQCVQSDVNVIPVVLPGGQVPKDMLFATRAPVKFLSGGKDRNALDQLEFGITGRNPRDRRGRFEILAEVASTESSCFLAVSHATSSEIYDVMVQAALDAGLLVKQPREFTPQAQNVYTPDVVVGIRSATVIVADGTPHTETIKPDADVMYEVGLAEAFAKPIVLVSTPRNSALPLPIFVCDGTCSRIEYDPSEVNVFGPLREELTNRLRDIRKHLRPPHLVRENDLGLSVAYSEVCHHRAVFWQPFEQIIHYGLTIKRVFADILKHVHKMQHIMDMAHADAKAARPMVTLETSLHQFRDVYDEFCGVHMKDFELGDSWKVAKNEAARGFGVLQEIAAATEDADRSVKSFIAKASLFFDILETYLGEYSLGHAALLSRVGTPSQSPLRQAIHLHSDVQALAYYAEQVPSNACEMMFQLLELIGMRSEHGGCSNDRAHA